ncbi:MAG: hypothetical protein JXQ73_24325 [Phycisphaerae bacterium]|nr:hypothetical protein [Phycisphaerae bacterium]
MGRLLVVGTFAVALMGLGLGSGCTEEELAAVAPQVAELVGSVLTDVDAGGTMLQTRDQLRDQLRDGSCDDGPVLDGTGTQTQSGAGQGNGDTLRLRDGSCNTTE